MNPVRFLEEVIQETKKLTWPSRESIVVGTISVFVFSAFLVLYTMIIDIITTRIITFIINLLG